MVTTYQSLAVVYSQESDRAPKLVGSHLRGDPRARTMIPWKAVSAQSAQKLHNVSGKGRRIVPVCTGISILAMQREDASST